MHRIVFLLHSHLKADLIEWVSNYFPYNFASALLSSSVCVTDVKSNFTFLWSMYLCRNSLFSFGSFLGFPEISIRCHCKSSLIPPRKFLELLRHRCWTFWFCFIIYVSFILEAFWENFLILFPICFFPASFLLLNVSVELYFENSFIFLLLKCLYWI